MNRPFLMAVDAEPASLRIIGRELSRRYGQDYRVICESSATAALRRLEKLRDAGEPVAVILADYGLPEMNGSEFLARAHALYTTAKRGLLFAWGDRTASQPVLRAMALGQIEYYLTKPAQEPDEQFHRVIAEFLDEWTRGFGARFVAVRIIGEQWSPRSHELRDVLGRNGLPYDFIESHTDEAAALLRKAGLDASRLPVLILHDGEVLVDPPNERIADAFGVNNLPQGVVDIAVIGAGPAGLAAAMYGASEGLATVILEREALGGQAGSSALIRNYLGFPRGISGAELALRAFDQAWLFGAIPHLIRPVVALRRSEGVYGVKLGDGSEIMARAVVIATGISYRRLGVPGLDALTGAGVFYGAAVTEARAMQGQRVFVAGGGNSAGQAALHLAKYAEQVTLLVRAESLAESMSDYLITEISAAGNIEVLTRVEIVGGEGEGRLEALLLKDHATGTTRTAPAAALFVLIGAQPHTDWLPPEIERDSRGYILTGADLVRDGKPPAGWERLPLLLETSLFGVFAAGDVRARSIKRVAAAVGEGAATISLIHEYLAERAAPP
jgi:thioredoxin reductase (NADPH)